MSVPLQECPHCNQEMGNIQDGEHYCLDCEQELTWRQCVRFEGICPDCAWLLDK